MKLVLASLAIAALPAAAPAQTPASPALSREVVLAGATAMFARADTNGDGRVTRAEFDRARPPQRAGNPRNQPGRLFAQADANGDGAVTRTEMRSAIDGYFAQRDPARRSRR